MGKRTVESFWAAHQISMAKRTTFILSVLLVAAAGCQPRVGGETLRSKSSAEKSAAWINTGPYGAEFQAVTIDPVNPNTIYAASRGAGVLRSSDRGASWSPMNEGLPDRSVSAQVAIDPNNPGTLFVGMASGDIYKSTDRAQTWFRTTPSRTVNGVIRTLVVDPFDSSILVGLFFGGVYQSTDGGATWEQSPPMSGRSVYALTFDLNHPNTIYAGTLPNVIPNGIFKTIDHGTTWTPLGLADQAVWSITLDPTDSDTIYAGTNQGLYKSGDAGLTWVQTALRSHTIMSILVDPTHPSTVYAGSVDAGVFVSYHQGSSWLSLNTGLGSPHVIWLSMDVGHRATTLLAATAVDVFKFDGVTRTWSPLQVETEPRYSVGSMALNPLEPDTLYLGPHEGGVFRTVDAGRTWSEANTGFASSTGALKPDPLDSNTVYAGLRHNGIMKSTDRGYTWSQLALANFYITDLAIDHADSRNMFAAEAIGMANGGIIKSTDGGQTWSDIVESALVWVMETDPRDSNLVYAGATISSTSSLKGFLKSTDAGRTWMAMNEGLPPSGAVRSLAIDRNRRGTIFAGTGAGLFTSTNGGATWSPNPDLPNSTMLAVAIDPSDSRIIYALSNQFGAYKSSDGGATWTAINDGLTDLQGSALAVNNLHPNVIHLGTLSSSVFVSCNGGENWNQLGDRVTGCGLY